MRLFIENTDSEGTVFRCNHASNPLPIKGTFNADKEKMIREIDQAVARRRLYSKMWREL